MKSIIGVFIVLFVSFKVTLVDSSTWKASRSGKTIWPTKWTSLQKKQAAELNIQDTQELFDEHSIESCQSYVSSSPASLSSKNPDDSTENRGAVYNWVFTTMEVENVEGDGRSGEEEDSATENDIFIDDEDDGNDDDSFEDKEDVDFRSVLDNNNANIQSNRKLKHKSNRKRNYDDDSDDDSSSIEKDVSLNSVDDIEEIDLDDEGEKSSNSQRQSVDTMPIKAIWKTFIQSPPSITQINNLLERNNYTVVLQSSNDSVVPSVKNITNINSRQLALLKPNGTDKDSLYRQLLSQFLFPLESGGRRALWLDTEMVLTFKGLAVLSLFPSAMTSPKITSDTDNEAAVGSPETNPIVAQFARAFRMISPRDKKQQSELEYGVVSNGLYWIHQMIVKALAHSIQANVLVLNHRVMEKVEELVEQYFQEKIEVDGEEKLSEVKVTRPLLLSSLFDLLNHDQSIQAPTIVVFNDNLNWLLRDEECSEIILDETRKTSSEIGSASKVLFVAIEPNNDSKALSQGLPSAPTATIDTENEKPPQSVPNPSAPMGFQPGNVQMFPQGMPLPPGMFPTTQVVARGFQVVVKNGTATVTPMPATPIPPGLQGSPEMVRKLIEQQQLLSQNSANVTLPTFSFPLFPSSMSEDEIDEYMRDPENQPKIKGVLDSLVSMVGQRLNQMLSSGQMVSHVNVHLPDGPALFPNSQSKLSGVEVAKPPLSETQQRDHVENTEQRSRWLNNPTTPSISSHKPSKSVEKSSSSSSKKISTSGKILMNLFEDLIIEAPRDHQLKTIWEKFISEEIEHRLLVRNKRIFLQELKKAKLLVENNKPVILSTDTSCSIADECVPAASTAAMQKMLDSLQHTLSKQIISRDQVKDCIALALKFEAGRSSVVNTLPTADKVASPSKALSVDVSQSIAVPMRVSSWSLDLALSSILKNPNPTIGRPVARSKECISNIAADKYEKALIENVISPQDIGVTYDMIGGLEEVKEMMRQCITYPLKYPRLYQEGVANEAVKGLLLFGPPGTGKTMLAKAVATEGGATFMTVDASTIESKWLGDSEKNARAVFTLARKLAPCVIYLDEVDSILASREHGDESSHGTLTSVKTTLMQEWDGLKTSKDRVIVIASTNRPFDLDEAVLRRLPRRIMVDLPDHNTRKEILQVTLANNRVDSDVDFDKLADRLEGYTGSDIKEVCREAVVRISHELAKSIEQGRSSDEGGINFLMDSKTYIRPVSMKDFQMAMKKLKASVSDNGREMAKVIEWNAKYGEIKKSKKQTSSLNLYI